MKLAAKHHRAVLDAAQAIREGIALSRVRPPIDEEAARFVHQAAGEMEHTASLLDEVAVEILRSLPRDTA